MKRQYSFKTLLFSVVGICLLLAPMLIELYHSANDFHVSREVCTEQITHFHQTPLDCSICDFQISFFTYDFLELGFNTITTYYYRTSLLTTCLGNQKAASHYLLRGPPRLV